jgi:hypothetical protein
MEHTTLAQDPSVSLTAACQTTDEYLRSLSPCLDQIGTPVMRNVVLGGLGVNDKVGGWVGPAQHAPGLGAQ